jgi:hypothetical protein
MLHKKTVIIACFLGVFYPMFSQTTGILFSKKTSDIFNSNQEKFNYDFKRIITIDQTHYYKDLGFFCKQEIKVERMFKFPIKFRLGSLDYVNWMENKSKSLACPLF